MYQNFKVTKVVPTKGEYKDQDYVLVDFKYELLTGAGFEVERSAVASVTSQGAAVEALWAASTRIRYVCVFCSCCFCETVASLCVGKCLFPSSFLPIHPPSKHPKHAGSKRQNKPLGILLRVSVATLMVSTFRLSLWMFKGLPAAAAAKGVLFWEDAPIIN